jgi:hypothetical protein
VSREMDVVHLGGDEHDALVDERDRLREALHHLNVCANTLDYCYFRNPGKFSAALSDLRNSADKARAALEGKP